MRRYAAATAALVLALSVAGCGSDDEPDTDASPTEPTSSATSESPTPSPSASGTPSGSTSPTQAAGLPEPGTEQAPAKVTPTTDLLDFKRDVGVDASDGIVVTAGTKYVAMTTGDQRTARFGVGNSGDIATIKAPRGFHWDEALLDGEWAVLVAQHDQEGQPAVATVVNLAKGTRSRLDAGSDPATVNGGSWALGQGRLFHPTLGRDNAYCLAEVDLATGAGQTTYCAEPKTGFNNVRITPGGLSLTAFDAGAISCRTPTVVGEAAMEPMAGVPECRGWSGIAMPDDGAVFDVVQKENRVEQSQVIARVGDGFYDLGPATTGTLTWCGDAAYFSQDPQASGDPARLLRWDGESLAVVYQGGAGGEATLSPPRCGGDAITVSLLAESGDEQVTAPLS